EFSQSTLSLSPRGTSGERARERGASSPRPSPPLHGGAGACLVAVCRAAKRLLQGFLFLASKAPPRGGTRPTPPCRPGPLIGRPKERPTPDPSQEGGKYSSAPRKFSSWEGLGVGSWAKGATGNPGSRVRGGGTVAWRIGLLLFVLEWAAAGAGSSDWRVDIVKSANLIYAGSKSLVCFSDRFLV